VSGPVAAGSGIDSRRAALNVLVAVAGGGRSDRSLDRALRATPWSDSDRRLITEIVYGTLRRRGSLDRSLAPYCRPSWRRLQVPVREAIRMGAYQAGFLRTVPSRAAVHATVGAVAGRAASGLVNAVLRSWLRDGARLDTGGEDLAARLEAPGWLVQRWLQRYGLECTERWFEAALQPALSSVRIHTAVIDPEAAVAALARQGVATEPASWSERVLRIRGGRPLAVREVRDGKLTLRGEAGQIVAGLLPAGGRCVLDTCAGRGGKTVQLAEEHPGAGCIVAADTRVDALRRCLRASRRAGTEVAAIAADMSGPVPLRGRFDRILVDAPCSGLGTLRRHPEIRWRARPRRLRRQAVLQARILTSAAALLTPGGLLLYTTCSTEPEENEGVLEAVLDKRPWLSIQTLQPAPQWQHLVGADGAFRSFPHEPDLDGFFAVLLRREASED